MEFKKELEIALQIAKEASKIVMKIYNDNSAVVTIKSDNSPVTQADLQSDEYIRTELKKHFPDYGFLTEETEDDLGRINKDFVWIIDPIDGTKDFIYKTDEFAINIALSYQGEIVVGVIAIPAKNEYYYASKNKGSYREVNGCVWQNKVSDCDSSLIAYRSRFHKNNIEEEYYNQRNDLIVSRLECGSSYKSCKIASGEGHVYIKIGEGTKEWDIAPCSIIVEEAGGFFSKPNGDKIRFNKKDVYNHEGFLVVNKHNKKLLF